jgi:hypothetical protein
LAPPFLHKLTSDASVNFHPSSLNGLMSICTQSTVAHNLVLWSFNVTSWCVSMTVPLAVLLLPTMDLGWLPVQCHAVQTADCLHSFQGLPRHWLVVPLVTDQTKDTVSPVTGPNSLSNHLLVRKRVPQWHLAAICQCHLYHRGCRLACADACQFVS